MGCGGVGPALSVRLIELGHSVAIIDKEESAFVAVGNDFTGQKVLGVGFDRDTLIEAGIEKAQAFAAVSSGDNSNIVSARVARENFNVPLVVARIYDPRRAKVYERLGIPTVASVAWTTDQVLRRLLPLGAQEEWRDPSGNVVLAQVYLSPKWIGKKQENTQYCGDYHKGRQCDDLKFSSIGNKAIRHCHKIKLLPIHIIGRLQCTL